MKFKAPFSGVKAGEIYPTEFTPGDDCPEELVDAAIALDVLDLGEKVEKDLDQLSSETAAAKDAANAAAEAEKTAKANADADAKAKAAAEAKKKAAAAADVDEEKSD
ncbi:MAG: hypothetical protein AAF619_13095 [Pseudomonadota bacterium]